jgi:hypothetical protein
MPAVKFSSHLDLEQKISFLNRLYLTYLRKKRKEGGGMGRGMGCEIKTCPKDKKGA